MQKRAFEVSRDRVRRLQVVGCGLVFVELRDYVQL